MTQLTMIHGEIRWLVALAAAVALARFSYGLALKKEYGGLDRGLMSGFTGLLDLNLVLGLVLLVGLEGGLTGPRIEHGVTMLLATVAAHASVAWKRSEDSAKKFRNNMIVIVVAVLLVVVAVVRLRGGWIFH